MLYVKRILSALILIVLSFAVLNWQFFREEIRYHINPPEKVEDQENVIGTAPVENNVEPNRLWIRSLNIEAPIIYVEEENEDAFQVGLQSGVAHYPGTALPGQNGKVYIFGHSSDYFTAPGNYKTVFAWLPKIEIDSIIEISDMEGNLFKYKVEKKEVVKPSEVHVLEQDNSKRQLALQTSYPVGTALRRYIVTANLVE